jgi:hypothetical protein
MFNIAEASRMLDTFASVGAMHFDVTFLAIDGNKQGFRPDQSVRPVRNSLPHLFPGLPERARNLIVRPICEKAQLKLGKLLEASSRAITSGDRPHEGNMASPKDEGPDSAAPFARTVDASMAPVSRHLPTCVKQRLRVPKTLFHSVPVIIWAKWRLFVQWP